METKEKSQSLYLQGSLLTFEAALAARGEKVSIPLFTGLITDAQLPCTSPARKSQSLYLQGSLLTMIEALIAARAKSQSLYLQGSLLTTLVCFKGVIVEVSQSLIYRAHY